MQAVRVWTLKGYIGGGNHLTKKLFQILCEHEGWGIIYPQDIIIGYIPSEVL